MSARGEAVGCLMNTAHTHAGDPSDESLRAFAADALDALHDAGLVVVPRGTRPVQAAVDDASDVAGRVVEAVKNAESEEEK